MAKVVRARGLHKTILQEPGSKTVTHRIGNYLNVQRINLDGSPFSAYKECDTTPIALTGAIDNWQGGTNEFTHAILNNPLQQMVRTSANAPLYGCRIAAEPSVWWQWRLFGANDVPAVVDAQAKTVTWTGAYANHVHRIQSANGKLISGGRINEGGRTTIDYTVKHSDSTALRMNGQTLELYDKATGETKLSARVHAQDSSTLAPTPDGAQSLPVTMAIVGTQLVNDKLYTLVRISIDTDGAVFPVFWR